MAFIRCPQCNTVIEKPASGTPVCPNCGFGAATATTAKSPKKAATKTTAKKTAAKSAAAAVPPPAEMPPLTAAPPPTAWAQAPTAPHDPMMMSPPSEAGIAPRTSGKATTAMVLGIVACCIAFVPLIGAFLALPMGIAALVLGVLGVKECNRDPTMVKGKGMAVTGIVLGCIMVVLGILLLIFATIGLQAIEDYCDDPENADDDFCEAYGEESGSNAVGASPSGSLLGAVERASAGRSLRLPNLQ